MDNPYEFVSPLIDEDIKPEIDLEIKNKEIMAQNESELTRCHKCKKVFKKQKFACHLDTNCHTTTPEDEETTKFPKYKINEIKNYKCRISSTKKEIKLHDVKADHNNNK